MQQGNDDLDAVMGFRRGSKTKNLGRQTMSSMISREGDIQQSSLESHMMTASPRIVIPSQKSMFHNSRRQISPGRAYRNSSGKLCPSQPKNLLPAAQKSLAYAASVYIDA